MDKETVYHMYTANSVIQGKFDGQITIDELLKHGNFGLGTLNGLNGEMIIYNGIAYSANHKGELRIIDKNEQTPFAAITHFTNSKSLKLNNVSLKDLTSILDNEIEDEKFFYAIKIEATYSFIEYRSNKKLQKPYPTIEKAIKESNTILKYNTTGTLIGFRSPNSAQKVNVKGYHFHFIDSEIKIGGHVNDFFMTKGSITINQKRKFFVKEND